MQIQKKNNTFFCIFKAFVTAPVTPFLPTPFCCLTGTFFLGLLTSAFGGAFTFPAALAAAALLPVAFPAVTLLAVALAALPVAGFLDAAPLAAGLVALAEMKV